MIMMVLLRLMQTSIGNACEQEDPVGIGIAYIIPNCPCAMCSTGDPMKYVKHAKSRLKLMMIIYIQIHTYTNQIM